MNDFTELEKTLRAMTLGLTPAERRKVANAAATALRAANARRIRDNVTPDGAKMEPRKPQETKKEGRIKKRARMFKGLRAFRRLKKTATPDSLEIGWNAADSRIALVHHHGLTAPVTRDSRRRIKYPARPLLGVSSADEDALIDALLEMIDRA
jgi:phage virion morphogenesis protein